MAWCLVKQFADKVRAGLKNKEINPDSLIDMTSKERSDFLSKFVGENNAKYANTLFESKLE